ncbi:carbohydrate-binding domain-containing protein [Hoylesella oralis]|uniref:carbohydrate-binding domain-containing protein n=1 Tax=Hoylesella oralis TaxID=28134 RepID=UPI0036189D6F
MNKRSKLWMITISILALVSCSTDDILNDDSNSTNPTNSTGTNSSSSGSTPTTAGDLATFTIAVDSTDLSETETIPSDDEDYLENNSFTSTISIVYNGTSASYSGSVTGVTVDIDGADVTVNSTVKGVNYVLSGSTSDGSFKMSTGDNDKKFELTLNGVSIKNSDGPAINIQVGKRCYVNLAAGTTNTISDGASYASSSEDQKGTLFSEGELLFSGTGKLRVSANAKAGIASDDYIMIRPNTNIYVMSTAGNGIKANDGILIKGGVINVETTATASKGLSSDGYVQIDGGRTTVITTGGGEYDSSDNDVSACAGVKADSTLTMNGGELYCKSTGSGGKGISGDQQIIINDGTVKVITSGSTYTYNSSLDSKPKGIKADGDIAINGGSVTVRATGGEGAEGIESKGDMTITSGSIEVYAYDDALNSAGNLYMKGGWVYAFSTNNDGLDANKNLYMEGGTTVAYGAAAPEVGLDAAEGYNLYVNGGTFVAVGGGTTYPASSSKQPSIVYGGSVASGTTLALNSSSANILTFEMGRSYNGTAVFLISSPSLSTGNSYTISSGATATGTDWHGLITEATLSSAGSTVATISSLASPYSSVGSSTGGMGGNGGRRW